MKRKVPYERDVHVAEAWVWLTVLAQAHSKQKWSGLARLSKFYTF